jgi:hypothetical protein
MPRSRAFFVLAAVVLLFSGMRATAAQADGGATPTTAAQGVTADDVPPLTVQVSASTPGAGYTAQIEVQSNSPLAATSVVINFGDGPAVNFTSPGLLSVSHTYPRPGTYQVYVQVNDAPGRYAQAFDNVTVGTRLVAVTPQRVLDTRNGTGAPEQPVGPGGTVRLKIAGVGVVPATGVAAVTMNVTDAHATAGSYVTVYPDDGYGPPTASNLNFSAGQVNPNEVTVPVGADGYVDLYNATGNVDLIADIQGYYATIDTAGPGGLFTVTKPTRILDTRNGTGAPAKPAGSNSAVTLTLPTSLVPDGATAVILTVTETRPTAGGYVSVYPGNSARPTVSNLDFGAGQTTANQVTVPIDSSRQIKLYNVAGQTDLLADLHGYFGTTGGVYVPVQPVRVLDSRLSTAGRFLGGDDRQVGLRGMFGVLPDTEATVVMNLTGINPSASTYLTAMEDPWGVKTSDVSLTPGETRPGMAIAAADAGMAGSDQYIDIYNAFGAVDVAADVEGYYAAAG